MPNTILLYKAFRVQMAYSPGWSRMTTTLCAQQVCVMFTDRDHLIIVTCARTNYNVIT